MRRVRRPKEKDEVFDRLVKNENSLNFESMKDLFILAACIGYQSGEQKLFDKTSDQIRWEDFKQDHQNIMKMIAFAETKDHRILLEGEDKGDKMLKIVEHYANKGLEILENRIINSEDRGEERLDTLIELVLNEYEQKEADNDILKSFIS
ncbi:DNA phosphorothioation-associated protein 4 [Thermodesulfobacteriota bacterium]